jgi:hypothetical protein
MPAYNIPCADGKNVTLTITKADPVNMVLRNLKRYHGLDSDHVMAEIFGNYTSANVTFDTDPDKMHSMLMAFWTGYEMAKH